MAESIEGRVAQILNSRELVINKGEADGVRMGMIFEVLSPQGEDIRDPDTNEVLGSVEQPKIVLKVVQVQEQLCVGRTFKSKRRNFGGTDLSKAWMRMFEAPRYVTQYDTLKTSEKTWEDLSEEESFVKRGDPARETHKYDEEIKA